MRGGKGRWLQCPWVWDWDLGNEWAIGSNNSNTLANDTCTSTRKWPRCWRRMARLVQDNCKVGTGKWNAWGNLEAGVRDCEWDRAELGLEPAVCSSYTIITRSS
jgi:hypothetical protein